MKTHSKLISFLTCSAMLVLTLAYLGCEDSPKPSDLDKYFADNPYANPATLNPDQIAGEVTIEVIQGSSEITEVGQKISVKAVGGHEPYTWSVANTSRGSIAVNQNNQAPPLYTAVYTALRVAQNTISVSDASGMTGILNVGPRTESALQISPSSMNFGTNGVTSGGVDFVDLFAVGGIPPYSWDTDSPDVLTLTPTTGNKIRVSFTANIAAGTFSVGVYVFDEGGNIASAAIKGE